MPFKINENQYKKIIFHENKDLNIIIFNKYQVLNDADIINKSHLFHGRYENIYIDSHSIPELEKIILMIKKEAAQFLNINEKEIKLGFWFNAMSPGDQTTLHCHDDLDEVLSGVYYFKVPENSGNLVLEMDKITEIIPEEGMLVMFSPSLDHRVTLNKSDQVRLSIGFNMKIANEVLD